jgi:hypothetical protein
MFSQLSDFTSFASKLTAELSLDNLQKEQEVEAPPISPAQQHPAAAPPSSSISPSAPLSSSLPSASLSSSFISKPSLSLKEDNATISAEKFAEYESNLKEKDSVIQSLSSELSSCQFDLQNTIKLLEIEKERLRSLDEKILQQNVRENENLQRSQLLEARKKDLELELSDLQLHFQSKFTESHCQESSGPCVACLGLQAQVEEMASAHQSAVENLNKKIVKIQKQNKKLEKDLQESLLKSSRLEAASVSASDDSPPTPGNPLGDTSRQDDEIQILQRKIDEMQREYNELKEKQQMQTTKMKDKVKEFIEAQKLLHAEKADLANSLTAKVSQ